MPTIFAIDGADFGAVSAAVAELQKNLVALGQAVGDNTLRVLVIDGLIGPKTTAATNRAMTVHIGPGQIPSQFRSRTMVLGYLTQAQVAANADDLADLVAAEVKRRPSTGQVIATVAKTQAPTATTVVPTKVPASTTIAPTYIPPPVSTSNDTQATVIKWSVIGLGLVAATGLAYYFLRRRAPGMAGLGWIDVEKGQWDDNERRLWVLNQQGLYNLWQSTGGRSIAAFVKSHKAEIDAVIRRELHIGSRGLRGSEGSLKSYTVHAGSRIGRSEYTTTVRAAHAVGALDPAEFWARKRGFTGLIWVVKNGDVLASRRVRSGSRGLRGSEEGPPPRPFLLRWNPVAMVYHVTWGDQIIPIRDQRSFNSKGEAKEALRRAGLKLVGNQVLTTETYLNDGETYKTFIRSATGWEGFSRARKRTVDTGLTYDEAQRACRAYNDSRSSAQIRKGTKMEFVRE